MKRLKYGLVSLFQKSPIRFRVGLAFFGILAAQLYPTLNRPPVMELSVLKAGFLLGFSTMVYAFLLTLYRIIQRLFRRDLDPEGKLKPFDERTLVRAAGLFWFLPFGLTLHIMSEFYRVDESNFGTVLIIQGLSFTFGAWLSQLIKK